jgi:hypothetical protein
VAVLGAVHLLGRQTPPAAPTSGTPPSSRPATPAPPTTAATPSPTPASPSPTPTPTPSPSASVRAVPLLAPPSAGEVSAVVLEPISGDCSPSAPCTIGVRVALTAHPQVMVGWVLEIIDRCSGRRTEIAVRPVSAPASWLYVFSTTTVVMPAAPASAIVALTTIPSQAASLPLLIPSAGAACA